MAGSIIQFWLVIGQLVVPQIQQHQLWFVARLLPCCVDNNNLDIVSNELQG